jgi:hypothetical protein
MAGEVVGITTSHLVGGENLNFAIPINDVKPMIDPYAELGGKAVTSAPTAALPDEAEANDAGPVTAAQTTGPSLSDTDEWLNRTFNEQGNAGWFWASRDGEHMPPENFGGKNWATAPWSSINWNDKVGTTYSMTIKSVRCVLAHRNYRDEGDRQGGDDEKT